MEGRRQESSTGVIADNNSGDSFSFNGLAIQGQNKNRHSELKSGHAIPGSPINGDLQEQESDFEFGRVNPGSPTNDPNKNSPADVLFFNGRLLPHAFPSESLKNTRTDRSQVHSCTSSIGSKDSLVSSRSNSSNSRSSSCSSGRTGSSENIEKRSLNFEKVAAKTHARAKTQGNKMVKVQSQGSTQNQRWQFIAPAPILTSTAEIPRLKKSEVVVQEGMKLKKQVKDKPIRKSWFGRRLFKSVMSTCKECHALEPSVKEDQL